MKFRKLLLVTAFALAIPHSAYQKPLQQAIRIAPCGNSITQADGSHDSYRYLLWKKLIDAGIPFDFVGSMNTNWNNVNRTVDDYKGEQFDKDHEGHWGWRADEILNKSGDNMGIWLDSYTPDMVLLHIGTNDCIQGQDNTTTQNEISQIVQTLRNDNPQVVIFMANLIPCNASTNASSLVNDLNGRIENLADQLNTETSPVIFVDQNSGFISGGDQYDGIHPNAAGEEKMAQKWFDAIDKYLNTTGNRKNAASGNRPIRVSGSAGHRLVLVDRPDGTIGFSDGSVINLLGKTVVRTLVPGRKAGGVYVISPRGASADK